MKLCTCFCHALEICTWFGYNPWINFCHFFHFVNFVIFWHQILRKCIDSVYLISTTLYTISCLSLCKFAHLFFHGLKMGMWFGFISAVNFCHFSTLLTLSFFTGATSTSPKFDLYFSYEFVQLYWSNFLHVETLLAERRDDETTDVRSSLPDICHRDRQLSRSGSICWFGRWWSSEAAFSAREQWFWHLRR